MKPGLLVISHGSRDAGWVSLVDETIEMVRARIGHAVTIEAAFLELVEGRLIQDGLDRLARAGVTRVLAVPLFVSSGSTHADEIGWALGAYSVARTETELDQFLIPDGMSLSYGHPMDDAPELIGIVADRLRAMSVDCSRESVLLIGHGSEEEGFQQAWNKGLHAVADLVAKLGGYIGYETALLLPDEVPEKLRKLKAARPGDRVLVMALFLSEGYFTKEVVPRRLASSALDDDYVYAGLALMPHDNVAAWIVRQAAEWISTVKEEGIWLGQDSGTVDL
ncbi:sirohydrochlorin chelatase [Cohnella soli]|uniref:Sirohydrochlorin chelatase n=1 Tax=Cohnella soli TaxID=425005 RepID=A0ABW0HWJ4_9BACL